MSSSSHLREGDVDAMLHVIDDARHDDPGEAFPWQLFHGLRRMIACDLDVGYICNNYVERWSPMHQMLDEEDGPVVEIVTDARPDPDSVVFWDLFWASSCASVLFVSVATVRKHMEHVRERLGVHSVRAAAAMALPHAPVVADHGDARKKVPSS